MRAVGPDPGHVAALAALNEPLRRQLYGLAADRAGGVSRDEAAAALEVARSVAAFHLDKLVEVGLLEVDYRRPLGRGGPGAGRPAKWYRRAAAEVALSVPERRYDLAALLMARAIELSTQGPRPVTELLGEVARDYGRAVGARARPSDEGASPCTIELLAELLAEHGYEPRSDGGTITLGNCPFHALVEEHRALVCGMNFELVKGVVEAAGLPGAVARLDPAPGRCCVTLVAWPVSRDTDGTARAASDLHRRIDRPNLFVTIPATAEGSPASSRNDRRGAQHQHSR
jgi:predicted ArsR family transcriptional regulator